MGDDLEKKTTMNEAAWKSLPENVSRTRKPKSLSGTTAAQNRLWCCDHDWHHQDLNPLSVCGSSPALLHSGWRFQLTDTHWLLGRSRDTGACAGPTDLFKASWLVQFKAGFPRILWFKLNLRLKAQFLLKYFLYGMYALELHQTLDIFKILVSIKYIFLLISLRKFQTQISQTLGHSWSLYACFFTRARPAREV